VAKDGVLTWQGRGSDGARWGGGHCIRHEEASPTGYERRQIVVVMLRAGHTRPIKNKMRKRGYDEGASHVAVVAMAPTWQQVGIRWHGGIEGGGSAAMAAVIVVVDE
jgi:hypothetical protein